MIADVLNTPMELRAARAAVIDLEMTEPMSLSFGTFPSRPSGWLRVVCDVDERFGIGYGEGATLPQPAFTDDSGANIVEHIDELVETLYGLGRSTVREAVGAVQRHEFEDEGLYPTARLTTEMALLDAATKAKGFSMKDVIGIPADMTEVPYGKSIGGTTAEAILRQAEEALAQNAKKIKIKVSPELFREVVTAIDVLKADPREIDIMVDANGGFDPTDQLHIEMLDFLDELGLVMIEEPVSRVGGVRGLDAVRRLRQELPNPRTPICLDDCLKTMADCRTAIDEGLAEIINIKPGRIGSFLRSLELADYAAQHGAQVMVGGMLEGTPGRCMTTLLGAYCLQLGFTIPGDLSRAQERLVTDLVEPEKQLQIGPHGGITVPDGPGWGF